MKKFVKSQKRGPQMRQRITQKHTMRNVVIASSILGCMAIALVVVNLSSNENSYANERTTTSKTTYRSVETHLQERMLIENVNSNRSTSQDYKISQAPQDINLISRSEDVIVKKSNEPTAE